MGRKFNFGAIPSNYIPLILYVIITALIYFFIIKKNAQFAPFARILHLMQLPLQLQRQVHLNNLADQVLIINHL